MALLAFSTGCAVDASDAEDETGVMDAQSDSAVIVINSGSPQGSGNGQQLPTPTTQSKTKQAEEITEPEPEPWKPHGRARTALDSSPGSSTNHK